MIRWIGLFAGVAAFSLSVATLANAEIIFESALMGTSGDNGGQLVAPNECLAVNFTLTYATHITAVGGHLGPQGPPDQTIYGAILPLPPGATYLSGSPFAESDVLGHTVITLPAYSTDVRAPLDLTLAPGHYVLVFGSGRYGATGMGILAQYGQAIPGVTPTYSFWSAFNGYWADMGTLPWRFVVEGELVQPVLVSPMFLPDGSFSFGVIGSAGRLFDVQESLDLQIWKTLFSMTGPSGNFSFIFPPSPGISKRFFRLQVH